MSSGGKEWENWGQEREGGYWLEFKNSRKSPRTEKSTFPNWIGPHCAMYDRENKAHSEADYHKISEYQRQRSTSNCTSNQGGEKKKKSLNINRLFVSNNRS